MLTRKGMHMLTILLAVGGGWEAGSPVPRRSGVGVVVLIKVGKWLIGLYVADHGIILMWALNKLISEQKELMRCIYAI